MWKHLNSPQRLLLPLGLLLSWSASLIYADVTLDGGTTDDQVSLDDGETLTMTNGASLIVSDLDDAVTASDNTSVQVNMDAGTTIDTTIEGFFARGDDGINVGNLTADLNGTINAGNTAINMSGGGYIVVGSSGTIVGGASDTGNQDGYGINVGQSTYTDLNGDTQSSNITLNSGSSLTSVLTGVNFAQDGILNTGATLTVGSDLFTAPDVHGISFGGTGNVTNSGSISMSDASGLNGINLAGTSGGHMVTNSGSIDANAFGIYLASGGQVDNLTGGNIMAESHSAIDIEGNGTVNNDGAITSSLTYGVYINGVGNVSNTTNGTINSLLSAVDLQDGGTVTNDGMISSGSTYGTYFGGGGTLTNNVNGTVRSTLDDSVYFELNNGDSVMVTNHGTIDATHQGIRVDLQDGVSPDENNKTSVTITNENDGDIVNGGSGIYIESVDDVTITNNNNIDVGLFGIDVDPSGNGTVSITNNSLIATGELGVRIQDKGTVTNSAGALIFSLDGGITIKKDGTVHQDGLMITGGLSSILTGAVDDLLAQGSTNKFKDYFPQTVIDKYLGGLFNSTAISVSGEAHVHNTGDIMAGGGAISVTHGEITNSGSIYSIGGTVISASSYTDLTTIDNSGLIDSTVNPDGEAIQTNQDLHLTNQENAEISAISTAVEVWGDGTIDNYGQIDSDTNGITVLGTATITNYETGEITGGSLGAITTGENPLDDSKLILHNHGTIKAAFLSGEIDGGAEAIVAFNDAEVTNYSTGTITGSTADGLDVSGDLALTNSGSITATKAQGVSVGGDATITNQNGGVIKGHTDPIGGPANNTGAVFLFNGGMVTNNAGGTIGSTNDFGGIIFGDSTYSDTPPDGATLSQGGDMLFDNLPTFTLENSGTITGDTYAVTVSTELDHRGSQSSAYYINADITNHSTGVMNGSVYLPLRANASITLHTGSLIDGDIRTKSDADFNSDNLVDYVLDGTGNAIFADSSGSGTSRAVTGSVDETNGDLTKQGTGTWTIKDDIFVAPNLAQDLGSSAHVEEGRLILTGDSIKDALLVQVDSGATLEIQLADFTFADATVTNNGAIELQAGGDLTVKELKGNGTHTGTVIVADTLNPGNSAGTLTFENLILDHNSTVRLEVFSETEYDQLVINGDLHLMGITVEIIFQDGWASGLELGHEFTLDFVTVNGNVLNPSDLEFLFFGLGEDNANTDGFLNGGGVIVTVPEPTSAFLLMAAGALALARRRKAIA